MQRHAEEEAFNAGISKGRIPLKPNYGPSFPGLTTKAIKQTVIGFPRDKIYNRSYQEAMDRPISIISYDNSDFKVRLNLITEEQELSMSIIFRIRSA